MEDVQGVYKSILFFTLIMKRTAGILAYKRNAEQQLFILLVHPGGPFYKNKDVGVWSIPKGEYEDGEDPLTVAKREFEEETGNLITGNNFIQLTPVKSKGGKLISAWAIENDFERCFISSNLFEMEWPPKSGKMQSFPEVDNAEWFDVETARVKINGSQMPVLEELIAILKSV